MKPRRTQAEIDREQQAFQDHQPRLRAEGLTPEDAQSYFQELLNLLREQSLPIDPTTKVQKAQAAFGKSAAVTLGELAQLYQGNRDPRKSAASEMSVVIGTIEWLMRNVPAERLGELGQYTLESETVYFLRKKEVNPDDGLDDLR